MHGVRGELIIRTFDPQSQALSQASKLHLVTPLGERLEVRILSRRLSQRGWWIQLEPQPSQVSKLVGARVFVYREELDPPREGEFYQGDLVGCTAVDSAGNVLGHIEAVWNTGPVPNLVITGGEQAELLVPFADDFVGEVDLKERRVVIRPPEFFE